LGKLERDGTAVAIAPADLKLLQLLAERGPQGARREDLAESLGQGPATEGRQSIKTHVSQLRTIVGAEAIQTGPGIGYIFRAPVRWVDSDTRQTGVSTARMSHSWWLTAAGAVVLIPLAYWAWSHRPAAAPSVPDWRVSPVTASAGSEALPVFSKDGSHMAFCWNGEAEGAFQIYIQDNFGATRQFASEPQFNEYSPAWSPDSRSLAFARIGRGTAEFCTGPVDGSAPPVCGAHGYPARAEVPGRQLDWSPDGSFLAVVDKASLKEPFQIYRIDVENGSLGNKKIVLTKPTGSVVGDSSPALSPDGKTLAFVRVFSQGMRDIFLLDLKTGNERRVTNDKRYIAGVSWTHDSRNLVFSSNREGALRLWRMRVDPDLGEPEAIGPLVNAVHPAVGAKDSIVYSEYQQNTDVARLELETGKLSALSLNSTLQDSSPNYGPQGRVAFASDRSGSFEIWVTEANGGNLQQLTSVGGLGAGTPRWAPDEKRIAFDSRMDGDPNIYVIQVESGAVPRRLTFHPGEDVVPSWSRDGKYVYYSSTRAGGSRHEVWRVPVGGTDAEAKQITFNGGFAPYESVDGKYIYYARSRSEGGIMRIPAGGGKEETVVSDTSAGYWAYWTPTRDGIYYMEPGSSPERGPGFDFAIDFISPLAGASVRFFHFDTKTTLTVAALADLRLSSLPGLTLSPDGKYLLFPRVQRAEADLKKLENY
jgi:Tol biopolymer transport system component